MLESFWWGQCSDRYIISLSLPPGTSIAPPPLLPVPNKPSSSFLFSCTTFTYLVTMYGPVDWAQNTNLLIMYGNKHLSRTWWRIRAQGRSRGRRWSSTDCLAAELFLTSCFSDTVFVTSFRAAVETAVSGVRKLLDPPTPPTPPHFPVPNNPCGFCGHKAP